MRQVETLPTQSMFTATLVNNGGNKKRTPCQTSYLPVHLHRNYFQVLVKTSVESCRCKPRSTKKKTLSLQVFTIHISHLNIQFVGISHMEMSNSTISFNGNSFALNWNALILPSFGLTCFPQTRVSLKTPTNFNRSTVSFFRCALWLELIGVIEP